MSLLSGIQPVQEAWGLFCLIPLGFIYRTLQSCSFPVGMPLGSTQEPGVFCAASGEGCFKRKQDLNNDPGSVPSGVCVFPL